MEKDDLYDYSTFSEERIESIITGWDGLGGYHGLLIKKCALLVIGTSVLDVGCGLCHLYEGLNEIKHLKRVDAYHYVGVEKHPQILEMARTRYPDLQILEGDVYDLSCVPNGDSAYAVGLYREEPKLKRGIFELLNHANQCVILTYFAGRIGCIPESLKIPGISVEFIDHEIDERLEIVRLWKN